MKRLFYLILLLTIVTACKEVFEAPPQALLQASFYHSTTKRTMSPIVTVMGIGSDSLLYNEEIASNVLLPLSRTDTSHFMIWIDSKSDSISFIYTTTQKYASMESGFYYEYKLRSIGFSQNRIDSVEIKDSLVTTKWNENIKIYIHPLSVSNN